MTIPEREIRFQPPVLRTQIPGGIAAVLRSIAKQSDVSGMLVSNYGNYRNDTLVRDLMVLITLNSGGNERHVLGNVHLNLPQR